jgi:D-3-phosphoglycerate dehydrogenase
MSSLVCLTDYGFKSIETERRIIEATGAEFRTGQCKTASDVLALARDADVILAQWAPLNSEVIAGLTRCRGIVRYGIGVDTIDLAAAKSRGIAVANVPDYCIDEVADHAAALAFALVRQLSTTDQRLRAGEWKITPPLSMPALRHMTFATAGFGRIARALLQRASAFGCRLAAYDPFVPKDAFASAGVTRLDPDALFAEADILSLHLPLTPETRHFVDSRRLAQMKSHAVLINTARGGLIDTTALAAALAQGRPAFAGLDVFEKEPLEIDHPLRNQANALLTSHTAWFSNESVLELQRLAAEEVARCVRGEPFKNRVSV